MHFKPNDVYAVLEILDVERADTNAEQMEVLLRAFSIFMERNEEYEDLWTEGGTADSLHHCRSKVSRMERARHDEAKEDSAVDLINYAAFFIRNLKAEQA